MTGGDDGLDDPVEPVVVPIGPELDLHSFAPRDVASVVHAYIDEAAARGFSAVRLVHGRGRGVQRGVVQQALERHPLVTAFHDDPVSHLGATIAQLAEPRPRRDGT